MCRDGAFKSEESPSKPIQSDFPYREHAILCLTRCGHTQVDPQLIYHSDG